MTQLATLSVEEAAPVLSRVERARRTDAIVRQHREATPPEVAERRKIERASIEELNALSWEDVRERFRKTKFDDRPAYVKALDLIDLPRNAVLNILAPTIARRNREAGETATFGLGRVNFSDVLSEMGVENHAVRGLLGFVGDVVFDPLTYAGGAGVGLRLAGMGGKAGLQISRGGARALKAGVRAAAEGRPIADDAARRLIESAGFTQAKVASRLQKGLQPTDVRRQIENAIYGKLPRETAERQRVGFGRILGTKRGEGLLTRRFYDQIPTDAAQTAHNARRRAQIEAAREFVGKYERTTGSAVPSKKILGGGQQVAHIPFTDLNLQVPAFRRSGRSALTAGTIAKAAAVGGAASLIPDFRQVADLSTEAEDLAEVVGTTIRGGGAPAAELARLEQIRTELEQVTEARLTGGAPSQPESVEQALLLANERDAIRGSLRRLDARVKEARAADEGEYADALHKAMAANSLLADVTNSSIVGLLGSKDKAVVNAAQAALGVSDPLIGASVLTDMASSIRGTGWREQAADTLLNLEKGVRDRFGRRSGALRAAIRQAERMGEIGADRERSRMAYQFRGQINKLAEKHGVGAEQVDDLASLAYILAHEKRQGLNTSAFFTTPYAQGGRNAFTVIDEARRSGLLQNKALQTDLQKLADQLVSLVDDMGQLADEGDLIRSRADYVPLVASAAGRQVTGETQEFVGFGKRGGSADPALRREGFQRRRTTDQTRFPSVNGTEGRFFEAERAYANDYPEAKLRTMEARGGEEAQRAAFIRQQKALIDEYDALPPAEQALHPPRPTDAIELNDLISKGMFHGLHLGNAPQGFFDSNIINVMASYAGMTQRAHARRMLRELADETGMDMHQRVRMNVDPATGQKTVTLPGGQTARIITGNGGRPMLVLPDGTRFRPLELPDDSVLHNAFGGVDGAKTRWFEDSQAQKMEEAAELLSPRADKRWLQTMDKAVGWWKSITLTHPSWMVNEMIGNSALAFMTLRDRFAMFPGNYRKAMSLIWNENDPAKLRGQTVELGGRQYDGERLLELAFQSGVKEAGAESEAFAMGLKGFRRGKPLWKLPDPRDVFKGRDAKLADLNARLAANGLSMPEEPGDGMVRRFLAPWFQLNRKSNDAIRLAVFMTFLESGFDASSAAEATIRGMYDFGDLTKFERGVRRFALPFASWLRANGAAQMQLLFEKPAFAAAIPKVQEAVEQAITGEEQVPQSLRPGWMREQLAFQIGKDPDSRWSILARNTFPQADAIELLQPAIGLDGAQKFLHYFAGSLNPLLKAPLEIGAGQEFFSGRSIGPSFDEADLSIPEHLFGQVRPLRELGVGSPGAGPVERQFGQSMLSGLARLTLGGRAQDFTAERLDRHLLRDLKDTERRLRIAANRAEREGNGEASLSSRVKLLQVYRRMLDAGLEDDVPRWAQIQLDRIDANDTDSN